MKTVIILNGFHQGFRLHFPDDLLPTIKLPKPRTTTICDCSPDVTETFDSEPGYCIYHACFRSIDGKVALFSQKGESEEFLEGRAWITQAKTMMEPRPLFCDAYFDCHDPRAWYQPDVKEKNDLL